MDHPEGAGLQRADRVDFDLACGWNFAARSLSSDGGLLVMRELDDALGLSDLASAALRDTRSGKNTVHRLDGLFRHRLWAAGRIRGCQRRQPSRLRSGHAPPSCRRQSGRCTSGLGIAEMGRFETETLALAGNRAALADLNGQWIDRFHDRNGLEVHRSGHGQLGQSDPWRP